MEYELMSIESPQQRRGEVNAQRVCFITTLRVYRRVSNFSRLRSSDCTKSSLHTAHTHATRSASRQTTLPPYHHPFALCNRGAALSLWACQLFPGASAALVHVSLVALRCPLARPPLSHRCGMSQNFIEPATPVLSVEKSR